MAGPMTEPERSIPTQLETWLSDVTDLHITLTTLSRDIDAGLEVRLAVEALERAREDLKLLVEQEKSYRENDP